MRSGRGKNQVWANAKANYNSRRKIIICDRNGGHGPVWRQGKRVETVSHRLRLDNAVGSESASCLQAQSVAPSMVDGSGLPRHLR